MSLFEDKKYKEMDWLEAACQPIIDPVNEVLAKMPKKIELTKDQLIKRRQIAHLKVGDFLSTYTKGMTWNDTYMIHNCFEFRLSELLPPTYNSETDEISGGAIYLVKVKEFFDEKEVEKRIGRYTTEVINCISRKKVDKSNLNEILEVLNLEEARKSRSIKIKIGALKIEINSIMDENRWNIRDMNLSNRVGTWIKAYIYEGDLGAIANFCKLKAMTHNEEPIYSITDEEKI